MTGSSNPSANRFCARHAWLGRTACLELAAGGPTATRRRRKPTPCDRAKKTLGNQARRLGVAEAKIGGDLLHRE